MSDSPLISVVMAVHNGAQYLPAAVESVLSQDLHAVELIVVDDCSNDATPQILEAYSARDTRVRPVRNQRNLGPYPSANRGLEFARSSIIARMDADDICLPGRLSRQLFFLNTNPDCLLVGGGYRSIDGSGNVRFEKQNPMDFATAAFVTRLRMPMVHPSFCFRKILPDGSPVRYDETIAIAGDFALAATLATRGKIASLSGLLVEYRMHENNISSTKLDRQRKNAHAIATRAVNDHYPAAIAQDLQALLDALYRQTEPTVPLLKEAIAGVSAAIRHDQLTSSAVRDRAAGILAEAFLNGPVSTRSLLLLAAFVGNATPYLWPLARRIAQNRNYISQAAPENAHQIDSFPQSQPTP